MDNIQNKLNQIQKNTEDYKDSNLHFLAKRKKVLVYKLELVDEFDSMTDAREKYGIPLETGLRTGFPQDDFYYCYGVDGKRNRARQTTKATPIKVFLRGKEVADYPSVQEAALGLNIHRTCIQHTLSGKYSSYRGYTFKRI